VRVTVGNAASLGLRVEVGEGVKVAVDVGERKGVGVAVFVRVGVRDNAAISNCASRVLAARVASALKFSVGEGNLV